MKRREFIALLGGAAAAWPLAALAQQAIPAVSLVYDATPSEAAPFVAAFQRGLAEAGFVEGQNVAVEYRYAGSHYEQLPALVAEFVNRPTAVIVGNTPVALEARKATSTIPIVFLTGTDPVKLGLVASFNRPGGNVTGVSFLTTATETKRLGLLRDLLPKATVIAALADPNFLTTVGQLKDLQDAAQTVGQEIQVVEASTESQLDSAFASLAQLRSDAVIVVATPFFTLRRERLVALADHYRMPAMYSWREFTAAGGLISYGASRTDAFRQAGVYSGRILKGAKPADLPVLAPTKFELVINMKTAKALGLTIPPGVLAIADEVIE
jgi:putative tryptophan/tyrosine transport system substrate-binding protein